MPPGLFILELLLDEDGVFEKFLYVVQVRGRSVHGKDRLQPIFTVEVGPLQLLIQALDVSAGLNSRGKSLSHVL